MLLQDLNLQLLKVGGKDLFFCPVEVVSGQHQTKGTPKVTLLCQIPIMEESSSAAFGLILRTGALQS